jgi:hypothetical protein
LIRAAASTQTFDGFGNSMTKGKIDFDVVRRIAMGLPEVEDSTIHGAPSLTVRGRLLTCPALHKSAEPDSLAVRIDVDQRTALLAADSDTYYVTDHYVNHPVVLVRLSRIHPDSLRDLLGMSWRFVSAKTRRGTSIGQKQKRTRPGSG